MLYAIITEDVPDSLPRRLEKRAEHRGRLQDLSDSGQLVMAGPFPAVDSRDPGEAGFTGSLIIAEFPSLEIAQAWADADPYVANGTYAKVIVKPFFKVF